MTQAKACERDGPGWLFRSDCSTCRYRKPITTGTDGTVCCLNPLSDHHGHVLHKYHPACNVYDDRAWTLEDTDFTQTCWPPVTK